MWKEIVLWEHVLFTFFCRKKIFVGWREKIKVMRLRSNPFESEIL